MTDADPRLWRSTLFVPATRPDRFAKAAAAGADLVAVDLEDAVGPADKAGARDTAMEFFSTPQDAGVRWILRINSPRLIVGLDDLAALVGATRGPDALFIPKADSGEEIAWIAGLLAEAGHAIELIPIVETAAALERIAAIATAPGATAIAFGCVDYAAEVGCDLGWDALAYPRGRIVAAAAAAGVAALDGVWLEVGDAAGLAAETARVVAMGFAGKIAIHPNQVAVINDDYVPSVDAVAHATRIVAAAEAAGGGVTVVDGRMINGPVVTAARRTLALDARTA